MKREKWQHRQHISTDKKKGFKIFRGVVINTGHGKGRDKEGGKGFGK